MNGVFGEQDYKDYTTRLKGLCLVEVSGGGCANCEALLPVLHSIVSARPNLKLVRVEANGDNTALLNAWDVVRVPAVLLAEDGEVFARCYGYQPEEILELWIDAKIAARLENR